MVAKVICGLVLLILLAAIAGWYLVPALRRNDDFPKWVARWIFTLLDILGLILLGNYLRVKIEGGVDYGAAFFGAIGLVSLALVMAILWRGEIAALIARPFESIYNGGHQKLERRPLYSMAEAKRKRGHYAEAIAEVRKQLDAFPDDFDGQFLLAEIQAENLDDLPGAETTIERICHQPGHPARSVGFALNSLADWHLKFARDPEAARQDLQKVIDLWPGTELSARAAQRIAHLADREFLLTRHDPPAIPLAAGVRDIGLLPKEQQPMPPEDDPARQAAEYVRQLQIHPLDTEARERLAVLYAQHYARMDLARGELEQLIAQSGQPPRRIVHWLNLLADLQIEQGAGHDAVRETVQRIIDRFPGSAAAQTARNRLDYLKLELKGKQKAQTIGLNPYAQSTGPKKD